MVQVVVGLGSNLGDRAASMQQALDVLAEWVDFEAVSPIFETAPMYVADQPAFLNAAALGWTALGPLALLNRLKETEEKVGRAVREQYGPREIDLDLIAFGHLNLVSNGTRRLQVPHPRTSERRFVLGPLAEIAPELVLPGLGRTHELLEATNAQAQDVKRISDAVLSLRRNR